MESGGIFLFFVDMVECVVVDECECGVDRECWVGFMWDEECELFDVFVC